MPIAITDPTYDPSQPPGLFQRLAGPFFSKYLVDPRDLPFIKLIAVILIFVLPSAIVLYLLPELPTWLGALYLAPVLLYFLGPVTLMLHCTSHRPLFKKPYAKPLNRLMAFLIYPLFGEVSQSYFSHHMAMHHPEGNLKADLSTTMFSQRDSFIDFLKYIGDFYLFGFVRLLNYLKKAGLERLYRKTLVAELGFYFFMIGMSFVNFKATLFVFIVPFFVSRFAMMAGNWAQHAFVEAATPDNYFTNSIVCINSTYNRRCFNDGYHIGHHQLPTRHWTQMPVDFLENEKRYVDEKAIVFEGLDYFQVWILLMFKRYDVLARRLAKLSDSSVTNMNDDDKIQFLRERTKRQTEQVLVLGT